MSLVKKYLENHHREFGIKICKEVIASFLKAKIESIPLEEKVIVKGFTDVDWYRMQGNMQQFWFEHDEMQKMEKAKKRAEWLRKMK